VELVETESIVVDEGVSAGACWGLPDSARCTAMSTFSGSFLSAGVRIDDNGSEELDTEESSGLGFTKDDVQYLLEHAKGATTKIFWLYI
jgi:hypothetical protein